jgi:PAS domain S-box-containing protein
MNIELDPQIRSDEIVTVPQVLVIDDHDEGRLLTKLVLKRAGFSVVEATSVAEAWLRLQEPPDIIVLDIKLPDGSGVDLARQLRGNLATMSIPIVHTSAVHTSFRDRAKGLDAGADAYLIDPIDPSLLIATVKALIRMRTAELEAKRSVENEAHLQSVTAALNRAATTDQVSSVVLDEGIRSLDAHGGQTTLLRNTYGTKNKPLQTTRGTLVGLQQHRTQLLDRSIESRTTVHAQGDATNNDTELRDPLAEVQNVSVAVPLIAHSEMLGALYFEFRSGITETQVNYLHTLAEQAANAFVRAASYDASLNDLQKSEYQLRRLVEYAPDAIVVIDATEMRCVEANPAAAELLGMQLKALIGEPTQSWSPKHQPGGLLSSEKNAAFIRHAIAGSQPVYEWSFLNARSGAEIECEIRLLRLPDPDRVLIRGSILPIGDRKAAEAANRRAADSALLAAHQRDIAVELQQSLLPQHLETIRGVTVHSRYEAANKSLTVGGDWFDSIALSETRIAFCVGDVVGHGLDAVKAMGQLRSAVAAYAFDNAGPGDVIDRLERFARRVAGAEYTTICYAELQLDTSTLTYACAGHPPPIVLHPNGQATVLEGGRSTPIGVSFKSQRTQRSHASIPVEPGSGVLFYSDGLIERSARPIDIGIQILAAVASLQHATKPNEFCDRVLFDMTADLPLSDDVAMLFVHLNER